MPLTTPTYDVMLRPQQVAKLLRVSLRHFKHSKIEDLERTCGQHGVAERNRTYAHEFVLWGVNEQKTKSFISMEVFFNESGLKEKSNQTSSVYQ